MKFYFLVAFLCIVIGACICVARAQGYPHWVAMPVQKIDDNGLAIEVHTYRDSSTGTVVTCFDRNGFSGWAESCVALDVRVEP